jgi:DNA-binding transcriptional ArsR family regulator
MENVTLDDRDRAVLERLREDPAGVDALATATDADAATLRERLPELADNGLVDRRPDGAFALTEDGERVLEATATGARDDSVDTRPAVEGRILAFDLPPDREAAVRGAFTFLQYWGDATAAEIVDGVYSEHPAGFEDRLAWWRECVRDRLAALPDVDAALSRGEPWRFEGTPVAESGADGRAVAGEAAAGSASARLALERLDLDADARRAVRAVFALLVEVGEGSATEAEEQVYPDHDAGYRSPDAWWEVLVGPALEALPGVQRVDGDRQRWRYRPDEGR